MSVRAKTLITFLLVGTVIGILVIQTQNKALFKGQIFGQKSENSGNTSQENSQNTDTALPDLKANLKVIPPEDKQKGDLIASVTIENLGPGIISGEKAFKYSVYLNDIEVFSNVDSYTTMNAGDTFNFEYPVSRLIYNYPNQGAVKVIVDGENNIKEGDEKNNEVEIKYSF